MEFLFLPEALDNDLIRQPTAANIEKCAEQQVGLGWLRRVRAKDTFQAEIYSPQSFKTACI